MSRHLDRVSSTSRVAYACSSLSNNDMCRFCSDSMMRGWTGGFLLLFRTGPLSNKEGVAIDDSRLQVKAEWKAYALLPTHWG